MEKFLSKLGDQVIRSDSSILHLRVTWDRGQGPMWSDDQWPEGTCRSHRFCAYAEMKSETALSAKNTGDQDGASLKIAPT